MFVLAYAIVDNDDDNVTNENSHRKDFIPRVKIENWISKLTVEIFMISQLMTQWNKMMKLEKYQQDKVMIILLVVH